MGKFKLKKFMLLASLIIAIILPTKIFAANNSVAIVQIGNDYSIYIDGLENKDFKFAFANENTEEKINELELHANWEDNKGTNIACIESDTELNLNEPVYMVIEVDDQKTVTELDLNNVITQKEMADVESLTTIISVDTKKEKKVEENENGVATTQTVGQVDIIESEEYDYQEFDYKYQLIKIDGNESKTAKELITLVDSIQTGYSKLSTYNKILTTTKIRDLYDELKKEATYTNVENYVIYQPEDSKEGDKYLVLLQQISDKGIIREDIQFLTCKEDHQQEVVKEVKEIKKATALPRTFDSIILLVVLAIIAIVAIAVIIRMKKLSKDEE